MNGLERDYAYQLWLRQRAGEVRSYAFEGIKLRLGFDAWYTPDFAPVWLADDTVEIHECKGRWREAARVRIKAAAALHPIFRFVAVTRTQGVWRFESIPSWP